MASPQVENGHIDIANSIADKLCSYRLSGQEWQIIWVVLRKTWGWVLDKQCPEKGKKKMDNIALSQFSELTGIDRRKCHSILNKLASKKVIIKAVTQKGDKTIITYGFQKNFDLWKLSPKKVTVTQKGTKLSPKKAHTKDNKENIYTDKLKTFVGSYIKYILETYPTKSPTGQKVESESLETIEKLTRLDRFEEDYIFKALRWAQKDDFWRSQVYSLAGLRKKSSNKLTKFQNLSNAYDKSLPEQPKPKIAVCKVVIDA